MRDYAETQCAIIRLQAQIERANNAGISNTIHWAADQGDGNRRPLQAVGEQLRLVDADQQGVCGPQFLPASSAATDDTAVECLPASAVQKLDEEIAVYTALLASTVSLQGGLAPAMRTNHQADEVRSALRDGAVEQEALTKPAESPPRTCPRLFGHGRRWSQMKRAQSKTRTQLSP